MINILWNLTHIIINIGEKDLNFQIDWSSIFYIFGWFKYLKTQSLHEITFQRVKNYIKRTKTSQILRANLILMQNQDDKI